MARPRIVSRVELLLAASAALLTFAVYRETLYPGIFDMGDAAKFAFVGKVLGTPHAPGYPLYVFVSYLFSHVPAGTLAHRINLLSAVLAAATVACVYLASRLLGSERMIAVSTALAFGFGYAFWSKALYAKDYTLNSALVASGALVLLRWGRTRRPAALYLAMAIFAISTGNHLIVIALVPALLFYAVATDARTALSRRVVLAGAGLLALGLSQYLFVLVRTRQHAPYLEARATNLSELWRVMTARRWAREIGAYSLHGLVATRVPIVSHLVVRELTPAGLLLAGAGFLALFRQRKREAIFCLLGALGVLALTANMSSNEDDGFLLPAFVLLWLLAGAGLQMVAGALRRWARPRARAFQRATAFLIAAAATALPARQVVANYKPNDHHGRTFEIRYFDSLFRMLPDRSLLVEGRYTVHMMLEYKLLGEAAAGARDIEAGIPDHEGLAASMNRGYQIFAFGESRAALESIGYQLEPVQLYDLTLPEYLDTIPANWTVVVAATPQVAAQLRSNRPAWTRIGVSLDALLGGPVGRAIAVAGVAGAGRAAQASGFPGAALDVGAGGRIGTGGPAARPIAAAADRDGATIRIGPTQRHHAGPGALLATIDPAGRIRTYDLDPHHALRLPFDMHPLPLFRVTTGSVCTDIGNTGWHDLTSTLGENVTVKIDDYRPFLSSTVFYAATDAPAIPRLIQVAGTGQPRLFVKTFATADRGDLAALRAAARRDGVDLAPEQGSAYVSRVELQVNDKGNQSANRIEFGLRPRRVLVRARVDLNNPKRATVCGVVPAPSPAPETVSRQAAPPPGTAR
ncbi:MAG TPA: DUF2723 domain-containing protein [Vicinamibacterales bacterium]|nr:DUF2723 domain-containing protein [Vicinamibacterales bacterium]